MHEALAFVEKRRTIYVILLHDPTMPCENLKKPYRYPVVRVANNEQARAAASGYDIRCKKCGSQYYVPANK